MGGLAFAKPLIANGARVGGRVALRLASPPQGPEEGGPCRYLEVQRYQVVNAHEAQRTMELEVLVENCATELRELRERVNVLEAALQRATCPQRPEEARQSAHRFPGYRVDHGGTAYRPGRWREGNSWRIRNPDGHISVLL